MKIKWFAALAAVLLLTFCLSLTAAADTGYTGEIDPETGLPYGHDAEGETGELVAVSSSVYYSWVTKDYVYRIPDSTAEVHVTAVDGMVLTTPVAIAPGANANITVYRNGSEYTGSLTSCETPGEYVISAQVGGSSRRVMGFTVVGKTVSSLQTFVVPDGFYIVEATRGGENVYLDRYSVDMSEEGAYAIRYECSATNQTYRLEVTVDRTPPLLSFQGTVDRQGRIRSKLTFRGLEEGDQIYLTRSGEAVAPELDGEGGGTIYDPGNYKMIVSDAAGNTMEYNFIILQYLNLQSGAFFLLLFAVIAAVVIYVISKRKRLKIG